MAMNPNMVTATEAEVAVRPVRRISWGAIIAGTIVALVIMMAMEMLGTAIGAQLIEPEGIDLSASEFAAAGVIWFAATVLISLFAGGWVAAQMAATYTESNGALHGFVTWATVTFISTLIMAFATNMVFTNALNAISNVVGAAGDAIADVAPEAADAVGLSDEYRAAINTDLENIDVTTGETGRTEITTAVNDFLDGDADDPEVRETAITAMTENTGMTREEAEARLTEWQTRATELRAAADEAVEDASDAMADAVTAAAGIGFMAMVLGAFAATAGGMLGTRDDLVMELRRARSVRVPSTPPR